MLLMEGYQGRDKLKKYFYADRPWMTLLFCSVVGIPVWFVLKLIFIFKKHTGDERLYDEILKNDIEYIKKRSVSTLGLIEEEYSLIDPITAVCFASESAVKMGAELTADKKNIIKAIWESIACIPRTIVAFITSLFGRDEYISKAVFYEGEDKKVRGTLVSVTVVMFTEQQILSYTCNYDIALGIILEEYVREVFYRDVDSVNYGDETAHILREDGSIIRTTITRLHLAVASGSDIEAAMMGESDLMENQIMAAKSLIRSKKESLA